MDTPPPVGVGGVSGTSSPFSTPNDAVRFSAMSVLALIDQVPMAAAPPPTNWPSKSAVESRHLRWPVIVMVPASFVDRFAPAAGPARPRR